MAHIPSLAGIQRPISATHTPVAAPVVGSASRSRSPSKFVQELSTTHAVAEPQQVILAAQLAVVKPLRAWTAALPNRTVPLETGGKEVNLIRTILFAFALGTGLAIFGQCIVWVVAQLYPRAFDSPIAAQAIFNSNSLLTTILVVLIWAPIFETIIGQVIPVAIFKFFTTKKSLWIVGAGLVFSIGHVFGGAGITQFVITLGYGLIFSASYVYWCSTGTLVATIAVAVMHFANNAVVFMWVFAYEKLH
ncbi:hypothetical protein [Duganella radicis]|uniref:CPBP family intramembrane metalloprotease n=1 Tax=Duganella radicis TaxID=551988 RepID=A0A6L6PR67_9BURK|nr:hypothetical protein [Duganella radicis]MTV41151.1 hypothetical protein [Duganella radicis]